MHGWDGAWYRRAYFDDGTPLGSAANDECRIDTIAQAWAVLSGDTLFVKGVGRPDLGGHAEEPFAGGRTEPHRAGRRIEPRISCLHCLLPSHM